jgi:hypothetical protein
MELNIVIPVYNRLTSIKRLITSLLASHIEYGVDLIISCEADASVDVCEYVKQIVWPFGKFAVLHQEKQLGVDAHNLACMRMAEELGSVLVLEDDLVVSPYFQKYLFACEKIMQTNIAGVALYRYGIIEQDHFPFTLIPNAEFVYYQQRACSKGTYYTWDMLQPYFDFLENFDGDFSSYHLPRNVQKWGDEVWEKSFYCYLISSCNYLAFPRFSFTTDFADVGVHMQSQILKYVHQSPLYLSSSIGSITSVEKTDNRYDQFYELDAAVVQSWNNKLSGFDFEMDMYGRKELRSIKSPYLLSSKTTNNAIVGWDRRLKPEINNILLNQEGNVFSLAETADFEDGVSISLQEKFLYYFPNTKLTDLIKMKVAEIVSRFTA